MCWANTGGKKEGTGCVGLAFGLECDAQMKGGGVGNGRFFAIVESIAWYNQVL